MKTRSVFIFLVFAISLLGIILGVNATGSTPVVFLPLILNGPAGGGTSSLTPTLSTTLTPTPSPTLSGTQTPTLTATVTETRIPTVTYTATPSPTSCSPDIAFTKKPSFGTYDNLVGQTTCVDYQSFKVAVYIFVSGWYNKPTWGAPLTNLQLDGSWVTDVTTGNGDELATQMAAFLVPDGYDPPLMNGGWTLPQELFDNSVAYIIQDRPAVYRTIVFSGYTWNVKFGETLIGPGPNYFTDDENDVWVDEDGYLHLKIVYRDGKWYCSEVFTTEPFGFGTYRFALASPVDTVDKNVVIGLFTWDVNAWQNHFREIDIEFSKWGLDTGPNAQYVVQPWNVSGNRNQFDLTLAPRNSVHEFIWQTDSIQFSSAQNGNPLQTWTYSGGSIPPNGPANARINVWLFEHVPPSDGQEVEIIIEAFEFIPLVQ